MIEYEKFCIIHMPRSGGSFVQCSIPGGERHDPMHDGWSTFAPFTKDVYGLIREPRSWYLSLHAYCIERDLIWKDLFGVDEADALQTSLSRLIGGSCAKETVIDASGLISPTNIVGQMRDLSIGLWSWWVLHLYGIHGAGSAGSQFPDGLKFLWLQNRNKDLEDLCLKYQCAASPDSHAKTYSRNESTHPTQADVFDDGLVDLINEKDGYIFKLAMMHPFGVQ